MSDDQIMVSITCVTYKHEKYIAKALDSFLMQKTNFKFEILVHDDASPDRTQDIIREYERKYPDIIKPIYQTVNQYSQNIDPEEEFQGPRAKGKYIAICEGDDYWCDPNKLQMQYDYMEAHPECWLCVHDTMKVDGEGNNLGKLVNGRTIDCDYHADLVIAAGGGQLFQTSSYFCKPGILFGRPEEFVFADCGDYPMGMYAAMKGHIHYIGRVMSCYRVNTAGSYSSRVRKNDPERVAKGAINRCIELDKINHYGGRKNTFFTNVRKGGYINQYVMVIKRLPREYKWWESVAWILEYYVFQGSRKIRNFFWKTVHRWVRAKDFH